MHAIRHFLALGLLVSAAAAQQIVWAVTTPTGLSATAAAGVPTAQTLPPGALPASGSLQASPSPQVDAQLVWATHSNPVHAAFLLTTNLFVAPSPPAGAFATAGAHSFLLHVSSPTTVDVRLQLRGEQMYSAGAPAGQLEVDVGNDGSVEFAAGEPGPILFRQLGPTPVPILVRSHATLAIAGTSSTLLQLTVWPENLLAIDTTVLGCGARLLAMPTFVGSGVQFVAPDASLTLPAVLVLGLAAQPQLLPPASGMPCLLLPAPDAVLLRVDSSPYVLPLPLAVRPGVVWAQALHVTPSLSVSDGYRIHAYSF